MLTAALLGCVGWANAQTPESALEKARNATFRVEASGCVGGNRKATGFLWSDGSTVVTALHVVAGCGTLGIYSETLKRNIDAKLVHSLNFADLAMLHLAAPVPNAQPLTVSTQKPAVHDELTVLGYPLLIERMDSTELKVKFGGSRLGEIVPANTQQELKQRNSPSIDLEITFLEGFLAPGASGAPIMDKVGRVVAIGDGGLVNGTVGIAWGVPAVNLTALAQSHETPTAKASEPHLFAAETEVRPTGAAVQCGAGSFTKIRTIEYREILQSTDDAAGLAKLLVFFAVFGIDPSDLRYDIYQDATSGAALAVPEGKELKGGQACSVNVLPNLVLVYAMAHMNQPSDMYQLGLAYERAITPMPQWSPDPNFTYVEPRRRADGMTVERKALLHTARNPYGQVHWDQGGAYETLAVKGNWFIGTTAFDRVYRPETLQFAQQCTRTPQFQGCAEFRSQMRILVQAVIAAHLTTFPYN
jgi:hypothetical protein